MNETTSMSDWTTAPEPADMSDPIDNMLWALGEMLAAQAEDRYEQVHVSADLRYLRGEARRAKRLSRPVEAPVRAGEPSDGSLEVQR